jgi:adenosylcobinamide kinase/adenosylcobinamide-phosphate guanylyltransferase
MGCNALFIGGIKSGKSKCAEAYTIKHSDAKPIYLATNEFFDDEMRVKVEKHKQLRKNNFITLEEPLKISSLIEKQNTTVLIECVSMWINNMLHHKKNEKEIFQEIQNACASDVNTVWVINDVSCSVVSENKLTRKFVEINGQVAQLLASHSKEVYTVVSGIQVKIFPKR